MSDQKNGLIQTPWKDGAPFETPDMGGTGLNGIGGGLDAGAGGNGIIQSPFEKAESAPGLSATPDALGAPYPNFVNVHGQMGSAGSQLPQDGVTPRNMSNTIDKR